MTDLIEIITSHKNQVYTLHRSRVTYIFKSHSCSMFYYRAAMHVKIGIYKSTLKLVYILGYLFQERVY